MSTSWFLVMGLLVSVAMSSAANGTWMILLQFGILPSQNAPDWAPATPFVLIGVSGMIYCYFRNLLRH